MHTTRRHSVTCRIKTGVKRDGTLVAKACAIHLDTGAYADNGPQVANRAAQRVIGPYRIPHLQIDAYAVYTNSVPAGSFRSIGAPQSIWACESQMDIIAERLGIDPLALRLKNVLKRGELVRTGMKPLDGDISVGLRKTAAALGWRRRPGADGRGLGLACGFMNAGAFPVSIAIVRLHADGSATLLVGTTEIGQGARTVLSQIAAEELALPLSEVTVARGDTDAMPFDRSTGSSRSTTLMGLAVQRAAREVRDQLVKIGAKLLRAPTRAIEVRNGTLSAGRRKVMSYADVIAGQSGLPGGELVGRGYVRPPGGKPVNPVFWEIGIGGADVEVDRETGQLTIRRYVSTADVGKAINPRECEAQDEGAAMMGLGHTLFEAIRYEGDQIVNSNLIDYRLPLFTDLPQEFVALLVGNHAGNPRDPLRDDRARGVESLRENLDVGGRNSVRVVEISGDPPRARRLGHPFNLEVLRPHRLHRRHRGGRDHGARGAGPAQQQDDPHQAARSEPVHRPLLGRSSSSTSVAEY